MDAASSAKSLQSSLTLCNLTDSSPPGSPCLGFSRQEHWSGCYFLLQCMKVKSESEVVQLCLTLSDPMDCSLPSFSICEIFQAKVLEWGAIAFSEQCLELVTKTIPKKKKCKKAKWLSDMALQTAEKREVKAKKKEKAIPNWMQNSKD